ncbi:MAG: fused MFS/spermidine synthase [Desulfobacca sp.]|uniref:fused MFS/spermidine synthase n=1 Tax=Desulfobacca sp. TaxID=2067990 RepID=UPI0040495CA4
MRTTWPAGQWFLEFNSPDDLCGFRCSRVLAEGQTRYQHYLIIEAPALGKALILDGVLQSASRDEVIYHEALVHPALFAHAAPQQVAVLGGGEGATCREVLRHGVVQAVTMVDLDEELVALCRQHLPEFGGTAWDDLRLRLVHREARAWLASQPDACLDVVIMDITDPLEGGPAFFLFTREMFQLVRAKLRAGGVMSIQAGSAGQAIRLLPHLHRTLQAVFPRVIPYTAFIPSFNDLYGFLLAGESCAWPDAHRIRRLQVERGLTALYWLEPDWAPALPLLPPSLRRLLQTEGRILADAQPFQQHQPFPFLL